MKGTSRDLQTLFTAGSVVGFSDRTLLQRFADDRDEAAFEAIVVRHGPLVWGVCRRILRDPNDAEDAFQATFLVLARKAGAIAHRDLLANWLYAVAYKTAVRARAMASRRHAREQPVAELPEPVVSTDERVDELRALLDQELSRLPGKYRIPVVLCDLEGLTHRDAAVQLGWPIGTVSSRLSRGRAMLAKRLNRQGVAFSAIAMAAMPSRLIVATARAARLFVAGGASGVVAARVLDLTDGVLKMMLISRLKIVTFALVVLTGAGLVWRGSGAVGAGPQDKPEAQAPPAKAQAPAPPKWAHLKSDTGFESWVRLEDGRNLWKSDELPGLQVAGVDDPASATQLVYPGDGPIERRLEVVGVKGDRSRKLAFALDSAGVRPLEPEELQRRMTAEGRRIEGGNFRSEAEVVDLDGRRCLRIDMFRPDTLGTMRLSEQTWYDIATRRPIQSRRILQLAEQHRYKREYGTTTITYIDSGPADIYALGVPAGTPIVDFSKLNEVETPPALQQAFNEAARGIERLPRSVRIVVDDESVGLQLTYWSAPDGSLKAWAAFVRDPNDRSIYSIEPPRYFFADHEGSWGVQVPRNLQTGPRDNLPADAIAAWLPVEKSVNVHLKDGQRAYDLTRFFAGPGKPIDVKLHVYPDQFASMPPDWVDRIWPFAFHNRRNLKLVPPEPGTPEGWVSIKAEYPQDQIENLYDADPSHDYAVAREVSWSSFNGGRMKFRTEWKALRWAQLPDDGPWYVTAWERLHHLDRFDANGKPEAQQQSDHTDYRRVVITPMAPDSFPPGIFDGEKFLEAARKEGAKIQVD